MVPYPKAFPESVDSPPCFIEVMLYNGDCPMIPYGHGLYDLLEIKKAHSQKLLNLL
jgi:hypothetical protein